MRAIVRERYGGAEVLHPATVADPGVDGDRIRIRIEAMSLNRSDWETLTGRPAYVRMAAPFRPRDRILGSDVAGVVDAIGPEVSRFAVGDRVFGDLLYEEPHCLAEQVAVTESAPLAPIPDGISAVDAACLPQGGALALQALTEPVAVGPGDRVLVIGGGGGAGTFALQIARHLGAEVHGVDRGEKLDLMRSLGASEVFDHTREDFATSGHRYTRIVDLVGRRPLRASRRVLADDGVYFMVGGSVPRLLEVLISGGITTRRTERTMRVLAAKPNREKLEHLARLVSDGSLAPVIDGVHPLEEAAAAMARLGAGESLGKIVITP